MKTRGITIIGLIWLLIALVGCKQAKTYLITNPGSEDMIDKAVVINRSVVAAYTGGVVGNSPAGVRDENGEWLPSQCDDLDGDGIWDEMAFLCDLEAGESKKVWFEIPDSLPAFPVRTNVRFGRMTKPFEEVSGDVRMKTNDTKFTAPVYQMEGPAWENEVIAFRNYYDARNGIDIFGKLTSALIMDSVGVNGRDYHTLADWGMDILKVGNSLGAGALAIGLGDSLYRVGPCSEGKYRIISEGPVRAMLELSYKDAPAADRLYQVIHRISLYAGEHFYRSQVWIDSLRGDEELVTGIVNLHNVPAELFDEGNSKVLASLGNQGFSGELLGMGIIAGKSRFKEFREAPVSGSGIVSTHLVSLALEKNSPTEFAFFAAWENRDDRIREKAYFMQLLSHAVARLEMQ